MLIVQFLGAYQFVMYLGSVHALNTSSRGASKTRVIRTWRWSADSADILVSRSARRSSVWFPPSTAPKPLTRAHSSADGNSKRIVILVLLPSAANVTVTS